MNATTKIGIAIIFAATLISCVKSTNNVRNNLDNRQKPFTPCTLLNEDYGLIPCDPIPLSINHEVVEKFKRICPVDIYNIQPTDLKCLAEHQNHPAEQYALGYLKYYGIGIEQNEKAGYALLKQSAEKSYPESLVWMASYKKGIGDTVAAFKFMQLGAQQGYPLAIHLLGYYYSMGYGTQVDQQLALESLNKSKTYMPASYFEIASVYYRQGNLDEFKAYNEEAVKHGFWFSAINLSKIYLGQFEGLEGFRNKTKVLYYAEELIKNKYPAGNFIKAQAILMDDKVSNNEVCKLYKKSYNDGFTPAGINLAIEHLNGVNCTLDYKIAYDLLNKLYWNVPRDEKAIVSYNLGYMHLNGFGVTKNITTAKKFFNESLVLGYEPAGELLNGL